MISAMDNFDNRSYGAISKGRSEFSMPGKHTNTTMITTPAAAAAAAERGEWVNKKTKKLNKD